MTPEALVPIIVKALKEISPWPWHIDRDPRSGMSWNIEIVCEERNPIGDKLRVVFLAHDQGKTNKHEVNAYFISSSPLWLAQMVVGWIQDREKQYASVGYSVPGYFVENPGPIFIHVYGGNEPLKLALRDFSISKEDYEWLKEKAKKE